MLFYNKINYITSPSVFYDNDGIAVSNGSVDVYLNGTKTSTFALDLAGSGSANIDAGKFYRLEVHNASGLLVSVLENVMLGDSSSSGSGSVANERAERIAADNALQAQIDTKAGADALEAESNRAQAQESIISERVNSLSYNTYRKDEIDGFIRNWSGYVVVPYGEEKPAASDAQLGKIYLVQVSNDPEVQDQYEEWISNGTAWSMIGTMSIDLSDYDKTADAIERENAISARIDNINTGAIICTCSTAAGTAAKVVSSTDGNFVLKVGAVIAVKFTATNTASNVTLNVDGTGAKSIYYSAAVYTSNSSTICGYASRVIYYAYDGTNWVWLNAGWSLDTNTYTSGYCVTTAATAAKVASCSYWAATANSYLFINFRYANTKASAITLNVNSTGAKPIYINGTASSTSNYSLKAGSYIAYYDGTNFYFRTDGKATVQTAGIDEADISNWNAKQDAISDLSTIRSGASAGATAVQPSSISDMETQTHASATYQPKGDYATSAQGEKADSAIQPNDNVSALNNDAGYLTSATAPQNVFIAKYGETAYTAIQTAYNEGKAVIAFPETGNSVYTLTAFDRGTYWFSATNFGDTIQTIAISGSGWTSSTASYVKTDGTNVTTELKKVINGSSVGGVYKPIYIDSNGVPQAGRLWVDWIQSAKTIALSSLVNERDYTYHAVNIEASNNVVTISNDSSNTLTIIVKTRPAFTTTTYTISASETKGFTVNKNGGEIWIVRSAANKITIIRDYVS